jgi:hypothetical protein
MTRCSSSPGDFKDSLVSSLSPSSPLLSLVIVLRVRVWGGKHPARRGYSYATETIIRGTIPFFFFAGEYHSRLDEIVSLNTTSWGIFITEPQLLIFFFHNTPTFGVIVSQNT